MEQVVKRDCEVFILRAFQNSVEQDSEQARCCCWHCSEQGEYHMHDLFISSQKEAFSHLLIMISESSCWGFKASQTKNLPRFWGERPPAVPSVTSHSEQNLYKQIRSPKALKLFSINMAEYQHQDLSLCPSSDFKLVRSEVTSPELL